MKITFYGYNSFLVESGDKKIAIDPGALFLYFFRLTTLIPKSEWNGITHILVTHGDPDHYWHMDRVASVSRASIICNQTMTQSVDGNTQILAPRKKGLTYIPFNAHLYIISANVALALDDMTITGLKTTHGPLKLKLGPFSKTVHPGPDERVGWGAIGYQIQLHGKTLVNLGDTLLHLKAWEHINNPDVLMIPIGGGTIHNTMDVDEALQVVQKMKPKLVIPCHYNCPAFFTKKYNPADDEWFRAAVNNTGSTCAILLPGESIDI